MVKKERVDPTVVEHVAHLVGDITETEATRHDLARVRRLAARVASRRVGVDATAVRELPPIARRVPIAFDPQRLDMLVEALDETPDDDDARRVVELRRSDASSILEGAVAHRLSGLSASERLGPFRVGGLADVWFELFFAARTRTVVRVGEPRPLLVLGKSRAPTTSAGTMTVALEAGTVWIRGDILSGGLPAGAYIGIKITGGALTLPGSPAISSDQITISGGLAGKLVCKLAAETVDPGPDGCRAAQAVVELPEALTFDFTGSGVTVDGGIGRASAWGQTFELGHCDGTWTFLERLWTVVLGYAVRPSTFSLDPIGDELVTFSGDARVDRGGLGFPVVVVSDPAALGDASRGPDWWLHLRDFAARWYAPDERAHEIAAAWLGIAPRGTTLFAEGIAPLGPAVDHRYALWTALEQGGRVPWRQSYREPFFLLHRCDVVDGEQFLVSGHAELVVDRPVQTSGAPIPAASGDGFVMFVRKGHDVEVTLALPAAPHDRILQLALRNALVWTTTPAVVLVRGRRDAGGGIESGSTLLALGVYGFSPTLPDPYVSNAAPRVPKGRGARVTSVLLAAIKWRAPDDVSVAFAGQLANLSAQPRRGSGPQPVGAGADKTARPWLTQVEQHSLRLTKEQQAIWRRARGHESEGRAARIDAGYASDKKGTAVLGSVWRKFVDATPSVLLLDVSTNQDLLGIGIEGGARDEAPLTHAEPAIGGGTFVVQGLDVCSALRDMLVVTLPAVQWEPVRTLDTDQDIMTLGWFPTPLASATDGGATILGARSQRLVPAVPDGALKGTYDAFDDGVAVGLRTTLPFGLVAAAIVDPKASASRPADLYELTRPRFPGEGAEGGRQITAIAEGGRPAGEGVSPMFQGAMHQTINGVDLATGAPLGLSVLGSTADPGGSVETVFNNDMVANPRVPVTRFDLSGYGASNFSEWQNPFAAFAEAAKVQFQLIVGRTALEIIKVNSVLHPWGIRVTRSVTVERRPGGGVIRRDSGWQPITPGLFDYRYADTGGNIVVAPYRFDAGLFRGLFNVRSIRPAPGSEVSVGGATFVPYYFDADLALDGASGRTPAIGVLGYLQTQPNGAPASVAALRELVESQETIGGPVDTWIDTASSGLRFRARRIEIGVAEDTSGPVFVATVRGVPKLPTTGAWSIVRRPIAGVPIPEREAVPVGESRGVPLIRRYPVAYPAGSDVLFSAPPLDGPSSVAGPYRFADAADLFELADPAHEYAILQSTPTHAFIFPRPYIASPGTTRIDTDVAPALADIIARSTSKAAFPPPPNAIDLPETLYLDISPSGTLALSAPVNIVGHPVPLRLSGSDGHGSKMLYDDATLRLELGHGHWEAEFDGLKVYNDIAGMQLLSGSRLRVVGSTTQRPQIAEIESLVVPEIEEILQFIPLFGNRGVHGPIDLGATNAKHEFKVEAKLEVDVPKTTITIVAGADLKLKLSLAASTGFDKDTGAMTATGKFGVALDGKIPVLSIGVASVFVIVSVGVDFSITSMSGLVSSEKLGLTAFAGVGVEGAIGPFRAYAYLGVGFILSYDITNDKAKYGGLVALEAGIDFTIVKVKVRAELKGLVYDDAGATKCDYSGSVKVQVDIFLIFSISASYEVSDTTTL